jgi:hypothetical protein
MKGVSKYIIENKPPEYIGNLSGCNMKESSAFHNYQKNISQPNTTTQTSVSENKSNTHTSIIKRTINHFKIIIDMLIKENTAFNKKTTKNEEEIQKTEGEVKEMKRKIENLKEMLEKYKNEKEEEINKIREGHEREYNDLKDMLMDKINSLSLIINDSNDIIKTLEKENTDLKRRNLKMESNYQAITQSHMELEKYIENNFIYLNEVIDRKDKDFSMLQKEVGLKKLHISSLEGIVNRKSQYLNKDNENEYDYYVSKNKSEKYDEDEEGSYVYPSESTSTFMRSPGFKNINEIQFEYKENNVNDYSTENTYNNQNKYNLTDINQRLNIKKDKNKEVRSMSPSPSPFRSAYIISHK